MKIERARYLGNILFVLHNLKSWRINFISLGKVNGKYINGCCDYGGKTIILDGFIVERMYEYEFNYLLIHEICHALLKNKGNHGKTFWKKMKEFGIEESFPLKNIDWNKREIMWCPSK